jgi:hypothetical protein
MPRNKASVNGLLTLRRFVKEGLELNERGASSKVIEGGILRAAACLWANCCPEERACLADGQIPDAVGWEEVARAFTHPGERNAPTPKPPPRNKHINSRAFDKWCTSQGQAINSQVETVESAGTRLCGKAREKLRKRLAWAMWRRLPAIEKSSWRPTGLEIPKRKMREQPIDKKKRKTSDALRNLGGGMIAVVQAAAASGDKAKATFAKQLFKEACASSGIAAKAQTHLIPGSSMWKGRRRRGRPAGTFKVTKEELQKIVDENTVDSCRFSKKHNTCIRTLTGSRKRIHHRIGGKLSYRRLCHRLRSLPIANARKRVDVCKICACWDAVVSKELEHALRETEKGVVAHCLGFWNDFVAPEHGEHFRVESPCYILRFIEYLENHHENCPDCPATGVAAVFADQLAEMAAQETSEIYSTHFWLKNCIRKSFVSDLERPIEKWTYLAFDFEELVSLPIGPVETSPMWYARNRLGVTTWGCRVWGSGASTNGDWWCYLSRVVERTGSFTVTLLRHLLSSLDLSGSTNVCAWMDCGKHFRNRVVLGTVANNFVSEFRKHFHLRFGFESHFKNPVDGYFAELGARRRDSEKRCLLADVSDLVRCYEEGYAAKKCELQGACPIEHIVEFVPPIKEHVAVTTFVARTMPSTVTGCYSWDFTLADQRRRQLVGRESTLTGTLVRAQLLVGSRCANEQTSAKCKVVVGSAACPDPSRVEVMASGSSEAAVAGPEAGQSSEVAADVGAEAEDGEDGERAILAFDTQNHMGWRTSYRTMEEEKFKPGKFVMGLRRKHYQLSRLRDIGETAFRRAPMAELVPKALSHASKRLERCRVATALRRTAAAAAAVATQSEG